MSSTGCGGRWREVEGEEERRGVSWVRRTGRKEEEERGGEDSRTWRERNSWFAGSKMFSGLMSKV
jgi:hypothetical protein